MTEDAVMTEASIDASSPGAGKIESINRGPRRALQSVVIELGEEASVKFDKYEENQLKTIPSAEIRKNLILRLFMLQL